MIYLIATFEVKPGTAAEVLAAAQPCIDGTRKEAGCISYDLVQSMTDENTLMFIERWEDKAALASHFEEPHLIAWREAGAQFTVNKKLEIIHPADVEMR